ncbi:FecR family protein [Novosphingobium sp.]|uniref:FecR family protein n=1 Tax=Novosphingobium sp. TaxID=1874826 RepID=UPI003BAD3106
MLTAFAAPFAPFARGADGGQIVGIASAILNEVSITPAGLPKAHRAVPRERVALADTVQTGKRSQLQVLLLDKSVFTVGANARLTIDRYVYAPATGRSFTASMAKGAFRFMSGKPDRVSDASLRTPIATIGIRGTVVDAVIGADAVAIAKQEGGIDRSTKSDADTASLVVLRGPGPLTQGGVVPGAISVTAGPGTVMLDRPMLAAYVPAPGAAPIGPFMISRQGLARINALIFPSLAAMRAERDKPKAPKFRFSIGLPVPGFGGGGNGNGQTDTPPHRGNGP